MFGVVHYLAYLTLVELGIGFFFVNLNFFLNIICGVHKSNKGIMPRVIPKVEEANTVPRSTCAKMVKLERRAIATSRAYYQRRVAL